MILSILNDVAHSFNVLQHLITENFKWNFKWFLFISFSATAFGEGVYFAVDAGYSACDTYSRPDAQGLKRMYLCNVLTGEYTVGHPGMRGLSNYQTSQWPTNARQQANILYDSVVDNTTNPGLFIIFNDIQAYPAYLITFK